MSQATDLRVSLRKGRGEKGGMSLRVSRVLLSPPLVSPGRGGFCAGPARVDNAILLLCTSPVPNLSSSGIKLCSWKEKEDGREEGEQH